MNLSTLERLVLLSALPREANYDTLKILTNLRMSLSYSEEEIKEWGITSDAEKGTTSWKNDGEAEIPIGEKATDIIVDALKQLDREEKLTEEMMGTYEKFISTTE